MSNTSVDVEITATYRFKFTPALVEILYEFSKVHQFDDRKDFKEAFSTWVEENKEIIENEERKLLNAGYVGDIKQKMFKSARYYFKNKQGPPVLDSHIAKSAGRKKYTQLSPDFLELIKRHLERNILLKPSDSYAMFCNTCSKEYAEESEIITEMNENAEYKIKKAFKNQYQIFQLRSNSISVSNQANIQSL
jgi:hypothetical protein